MYGRNERTAFLLLEMQTKSRRGVLYMQIMPHPNPLPSFPTKRLPSEASCLRAQRVGLQRAWGCTVKGGDWTSSICVLFIKWELVGLKSFCSKWRNRWLYFGGGLGLWLKKNRFWVGCIFLLDILFVYFFRVLHSNMRPWRNPETFIN